jgi:hypothetical protein
LKRVLKICSNITDIPNKEQKQPLGDIYKTRFSEAYCSLEENIKNYGPNVGLKR